MNMLLRVSNLENPSQIAKLVYPGNCTKSKKEKFRDYCNKEIPHIPDTTTRLLVEQKIKGSLVWLEIPLWKFVTCKINKEKDILKLLALISISDEHAPILEADELNIVVSDLKETLNQIFSYETYNAISAATLLLLKYELSHDLNSVNFVLKELRLFICNCLAVYGFHKSWVYLYKTIERRFSIWLNKPDLINDSVYPRVYKAELNLFKNEFWVRKIYIEGCELKKRISNDEDRFCVLDIYNSEYQYDLEKHLSIIDQGQMGAAVRLIEAAPLYP